MAVLIFKIIVIILVFDYLLDRFLGYLNTTRWSDTLPKQLEGIYDPEKYKKQQNYSKVRHRFGNFSSSLSLTIMLFMLLLGGFGWLDDFVRQYTEEPIYMALLYFGILGIAADILTTPLSVYSTFVIEERFGFNQTKVSTFILDKLKGWLLGIIIGGGLFALVVWIYDTTGTYFWLYVWVVISVFSVFMSMFYSNLIVPLFNKQTPLEDGELRDAIKEFSDKVGFKLDNIFVIDGSKRSKKANAYFTGLGMKKRIVLYDTLIKDHTVDELVAVLAHEIGHYKKKHTVLGMIMSIAQTGLMLYILSLFIAKGSNLSVELASALGAQASFHIGILVFGLLYSPLSTVIGIIMNMLSRKNEFAADKFAGDNYSSEALQNALKKLSVNNLSNLTPHPLYVFFNYSHPPLLERLKALGNGK
ncbi:MAG: M48 family metallopeptidase [Saprospiraceae bacterium]|nr:M48 family metallopeptidase [Saprospiraceae bacterium]